MERLSRGAPAVTGAPLMPECRIAAFNTLRRAGSRTPYPSSIRFI